MANALDIGGAIGQGLNQSMGNLLQVARESRIVNSPEYKYNQAMSEEGLKQFQADQVKVKREKLEKSNPYAPHLIEAAKAAGLIIGDEQEFTVGQIKQAQKHFMENPRILAGMIDKTYNQNLEKDKQYEIAIAEEQKKLPELMKNPVGNSEKIKAIQDKISSYEGERKPISEGRMRDSTMRDHLKILIEEQDFKSLSKDDQLIHRALKEQGIEPSAENIIKYKPKIGDKGVSDTQLYADLMSSSDPEKRRKAERMKDFRRAGALESGGVAEAKETGKKAGEHNMSQYEAANNAVGDVEKIDGLINHLRSSESITGMGAEVFNNIERAKVWFGSESAKRKVKDTEILDVMMGSEVFPLIKALGIGARGMDTPAEREFLRKVMTGSITLNKQTLLKMAEMRKNVSERALNRWNDRVSKGELDRFFEYTGITKEMINVSAQKKGDSVSGPQSGRVKVISPEGKQGSIPQDQLADALKQGYRKL